MRFTIIAPAFAALLALSACGSGKEDNQVTKSRMDDLESLKGTISDDMINTDESTDEAPVEAMPVRADADTNAAKATSEKSDEPKTDGSDEPKIEEPSEPK
jgi:predicted component of type VI protein secretion system